MSGVQLLEQATEFLRRMRTKESSCYERGMHPQSVPASVRDVRELAGLVGSHILQAVDDWPWWLTGAQ